MVKKKTTNCLSILDVDITVFRRFYHDLFGLNVLVDHDGNMILMAI